MPIYEYECPAGHRFDQRQPVEQRAKANCPKCGQSSPKQISLVNATFGWRLTELSHVRGHKDEFERDV